MQRRLALAGTVAALAAAVLAFGGAFRTDAASTRSPAAAGGAAARLASGFAAGDTQALVARLERGPKDAASLTLLGLAYQQRARETGNPSFYPRAESVLRRAARLAPNDAAPVRALASLAASRHRFDESLALARRARRLNSDSAATYGLIGDANLELGRYAQAFAAFDRQLALKPTAAGYARVSYARELLGDTQGAVEAMRLAVDASSPTGEPAAWARVQLANLHLGSGRLSTAERTYRDALAFNASYAPAFAGLGEIAEARGRYLAAAGLYRRALALAPVPDYAVSLGDALARAGRTRAADSAYARAHVLEDAFAANGGRNQLETAMFDLDHDRNYVDALARAREGHRLRPSIEGEHVLAWALYKNRRCGEARKHSIRALRLGTPDLDALYHRALIERCLGNEKASERYVAKVRSLNPYYLLAPPSALQAPR